MLGSFENEAIPQAQPVCDACSGGLKVEECEGPHGNKANLCLFCANTIVGNICWYPDQYPDKEILRTISTQMNLLVWVLKPGAF